MGIWDWSLIADANATADASINFQEGQPAATVNNSARTLMQRLRFWSDDTGGAIITGGTGNAYTATTSSVIGTLRAGITIKVRANRANTGAATLNVDSKGAKPWRAQDGSDVPSGFIGANTFYDVTYYAAVDEWRTNFPPLDPVSAVAFGGDLQAAVDYAAGAGRPNVLHVGTYTGQLKMRPGVTVTGGGTITQANGANLASIVDFATYAADKAALVGVTVKGNRANNNDDYTKTLIAVGAASDVRISRCTLQNSVGHGVVTTGLRVIIEDCTFDDYYHTGVQSAQTSVTNSGLKIHRNIFKNIGWSAVACVKCLNLDIYKNDVFGVQVLGLTVSTSGATVTATAGSFAPLRAGHFIVFNSGDERYIQSVNSPTSITLTSTPAALTNVPAIGGSGDIIGLTACTGRVARNTIYQGGVTSGIILSDGGTASGKLVIADNDINASGESGITVSNSGAVFTDDVSIVRNTVRNCGQSRTAGPSGFNVGMVATGTGIRRLYIAQNDVSDDQGTPSHNYSITVSAAVGQVTLGRNRMRGAINPGVNGAVSSIVLTAGWGSTAATSNIVCNGPDISFKITAGGTGIAANPAITVNVVGIAESDITPSCVIQQASTAGVFPAYAANTGTSLAIQTAFTPVSTAVYDVTIRR